MISDEKMVQETPDTTSIPIEEEAQKLPDKSRSLRARSIKKRLETERNKNSPKASSVIVPHQQDIISKTENSSQSRIKVSRSKNRGGGRFGSGSTTMSKYRRKTANAKERDRMKTVNEAFEKLKSVVPVDALLQQQQHSSVLLSKETQNNVLPCDSMDTEENLGNGSLLLGLVNPLKSTKVSTLRCAIAYINSLQKLIEDSEKGILDPSFYENEEEDNVTDIEMILGQQLSFSGDSNNNREKKKRGVQRGKEKRDIKAKTYLSNKKMSMIASSLNRNLSLRKINSKHKINNATGSKRTERNRFELKKVLKTGQCKIGLNNAGTRHNMNILNASIPEIMDIIRNATTMDGGKMRAHSKKSKKANTISGRENAGKAKPRMGTNLKFQKRAENISESQANMPNSNKNCFPHEPRNGSILTVGPNGTLQPIIYHQQRSPSIMSNTAHHIQPLVGNLDGGSKNTSLNLTMPLSSSHVNELKHLQLMKNKVLGGLTNNSNIPTPNYVSHPGYSTTTTSLCDNSMFMTRTNKLTPPQVKKLLSSLTPLIHPSSTSTTLQPQLLTTSMPASTVPMNSTLLLSPPPSNSSCSNYSCDEASTTSSFDDVNVNSNVDSNIDSCLISPSSNSLLSSSSLHTNVAYNVPSKVGLTVLNPSSSSPSPSSPSSTSENQLIMNCSNNSAMDILDDIQQVLKDAENFDILFAQ